MELNAWKAIEGSREIIHENPWFFLYREKCILPSGKDGVYHVIHTDPASIIIPVLPNGKIRMIQQYRYTQKSESLEFPCGNVRNGNNIDLPEGAAARELAEEAHLEGELEFVGRFFPWNGACSQVCNVFLAKNCTEKILPLDETEEFLFFDLSEHEIDEKIRKGEIVDGISLASWMLYKTTYANV